MARSWTGSDTPAALLAAGSLMTRSEADQALVYAALSKYLLFSLHGSHPSAPESFLLQALFLLY